MMVTGEIDWYVDWITLVENGSFDREIAESHYASFKRNEQGEATEIIYSGSKPMRHKGSDDSTCTVKVQSNRRVMSFNPSRWNREENVFGLKFDQAVAMANDIWQSLEQPLMQPGNPETGKGAHVTRLDLTTNLYAGSPEKAKEMLRHFSRIKILTDWLPRWMKKHYGLPRTGARWSKSNTKNISQGTGNGPPKIERRKAMGNPLPRRVHSSAGGLPHRIGNGENRATTRIPILATQRLPGNRYPRQCRNRTVLHENNGGNYGQSRRR